MINIVCLKWGKKYSAELVNRLYNMVKKNYNQEFNFWCCTEDPTDLNPEIKLINFPSNYDLYRTAWWKMWFYSEEFPLKEKCLYFDLDTVIQNDITPLVNYDVEDKIYLLKGKIFNLNSSIIMWDPNRLNKNIWKKFASNIEFFVNNYELDDEWLAKHFPKDVLPLPTEWVYSRIQGVFDNSNINNSQIDFIYDPIWAKNWKLYRIPEKMICILNGLYTYQNIDSNLREKMIAPFEKYWQ